jgi:photosystem II stability/assembly factor-like uncharacterized protein
MDANTFMALTGQNLARASRNPDGDWSVEFLLADRDVRCLAGDPLNPKTVYAGIQGHGVLRSNDGGRSWQPAGLAGRVVKALAASRAQPGTVYAGVKPPGLFVSRDGGDTWGEIESFQRVRSRWWFSPAESDLKAYVQGIALSPTDPNVIVIGIEAGAVVRTTDGGQTWEGHRPGAVRDCHSLVAHATNGDWMYEGGGTGAGAAFSRDGGQTWRQPRAGLDRHYGWAVAADPARPEVWYVSLSPSPMKAHNDGHAEAYIFRSAGGAAWQKLALSEAEGGLPQPLNHMPYALLTDPAAPGHLYTGLSNGEVWHSTDHGDTWKQLPFNLAGIHRTLIML